MKAVSRIDRHQNKTIITLEQHVTCISLSRLFCFFSRMKLFFNIPAASLSQVDVLN